MANSYFNENTLEELIEEIKYVYKSDDRPWVIGYSGGKDSTTVVELVYKMLLGLDPDDRHKNVYIVSSDTLIENPLIKIYLSKMNDLLGQAADRDGLPIKSAMVTPPPNNSFWANVIGRGFPTPRMNGTFRWCTDRLKINPSGEYIQRVIDEEGKEVVVLLGVRKAESIARKRRIEGRELANRLLNRHETIFDVKGPDEIVIQGETQIYGSPEKQARGYRFDWLNFLNDQFAISPVVLSMVCYPFISEKEYKDVRLDIVSSRDFTIFSDDLNSATKLGQKISNAFVKKKPLNSTPFDEKAMAIVRQHFEPSYKAKDDQIVEVSDAYSLLKVFNKELTEKDSDELIEMYFAGTKIVAFVKSEIDLLSVCNKLEAGFNARGIISDKGNVRLAEIDERNDFRGASGSYRIFNFEIYTHNLDLNNDEIIVEGQYTEQQKLILEDVANSTSWNFDQYKVEHAMGDKNVLVQAGAGTGKTYSMVSRIAYLCMSRKRFVNNLVDEIAMVTFTNEAADNMKLRLKQYFMNCYILTKNKKVLHEIEAVDLMQISTIHKFAKAVLQSSAMEYGLGADFAISSSEYAKEQIWN